MTTHTAPDLDRRRAERLRRALDVEVTVDGAALPVRGVVDISVGGLLVELAGGPAATDLLRLHAIARVALRAGTAQAVCSGRICRIRHIARAGEVRLPAAVALAFTAAENASGAISAVIDALRTP